MTNKQKYSVEIQFNYVGEVYDGDPTNLDELAELERLSIEQAVKDDLSRLFDDVSNIYVRVGAVRPRQ